MMHKPLHFSQVFERERDLQPPRLPPPNRSISLSRLQGKGDANRKENGETFSFSSRGNSSGKVLSSSVESEPLIGGKRQSYGEEEMARIEDALPTEGFSLLPVSRGVPHIIMDPLAVLRQCIRYFASHPEIYGTNLRCLLDREIMHVMRLQASESSMTLQQPVVSSDDARTALEIMRTQALSPSSTSTAHEASSSTPTSTTCRFPPIQTASPKGALLRSHSEAKTAATASTQRNPSSFPFRSPRQVDGRKKDCQVLGYGSVMFMPIRYDFEALTKKYAQPGTLPDTGGGGSERRVSITNFATSSSAHFPHHPAPPPDSHAFLSSHGRGDGYSVSTCSGSIRSGSSVVASPVKMASPNFHGSLYSGGTTLESKTRGGNDPQIVGDYGNGNGGVFGVDPCMGVPAPPGVRDGEGGPLMLTLMGEEEQVYHGDGNGCTKGDRDAPFSTPRQPSSYPSGEIATTSSLSPTSRTNSLWPMENVFIESLKQLMEQQFSHREADTGRMPFPSSSVPPGAPSLSAVSSTPSIVLVDTNGYEVSYLRRQLQQMEAAYNAKCIRLHELMEENSRLNKQLQDAEEKGERWLSQYRESHAQVDAMRRELEGWREKAAEYESSADVGEGRLLRKGIRKGIGLNNSGIGSLKKKSTLLSSHEGRETEVERITKLWRETEKSLQESRRTLENSEQEANTTHDHLSDAFHYIERLERRLARRNRFISTSFRRHRSLEEKYEKLMWCFREQSTIIGAHSYVDHAMADDPYWSLFSFYHLQQHVGDTYPMEETLLLGSNVLQHSSAAAVKLSAGLGGTGVGRETGVSGGKSGPSLPLTPTVPNLQFGRSHGGGRLIDERYDIRIIYHLMADEVTGVTERRGRLKRLRTNLVGGVGCKALRWENMFVIDYLGGEDSRPNGSMLNRMHLPLLTLASLTQPLRESNGIRMDAIYPLTDAKKTGEESERTKGRRRSLNDTLPYTLPEDPGPLNTYLYDQATVRLLLRNFWRERVEQFGKLYHQRVSASREKASRDFDFPTLTPWGEDMMMMMMDSGVAAEEPEDGAKEEVEAVNYPNSFLAGLMMYVFCLCGARRGTTEGEDASNPQGRSVSVSGKQSGYAAKNSRGTGKNGNTRNGDNTEQKGGRKSSVVAEKEDIASILLSVRGIASKDQGLWDDGRIFFACVANAKIRGTLPGNEATSPPNVPEFTPSMREMICAIYHYTMEYKEIDPDFRLFYLVSHQLMPEVVGINFYASIEAIQLDCEALITENLDQYSEGKVLEKIKKEAFPHTVAGGDGNFSLLGKQETLVSSGSVTGKLEDPRSSGRGEDLLSSVHEKMRDDALTSSPNVLLSHRASLMNGNSDTSNSRNALSPFPSKSQPMHPEKAYEYFLLSPGEAISRAAELIDRTPIVAENLRLEEDSDEDGYGTVLPGVADKQSEIGGALSVTSISPSAGISLHGASGHPKDEGGKIYAVGSGILCREGNVGAIPVVPLVPGGSGGIGVVAAAVNIEPNGAHSPGCTGKTAASVAPPCLSSNSAEPPEDETSSQKPSIGGSKKKCSSICIVEDTANPAEGNNSVKVNTTMFSCPSMTMSNGVEEYEISKLRHDLLDFLESLQHRRSSKQKEEYERRKERVLEEQRRRLTHGEDPREVWLQLDTEIRRIFGPHSEIIKDFMSLDTSNGIGGPRSAHSSPAAGGLNGGKEKHFDSFFPSSYLHSGAPNSLFLRNRQHRITFDDRIRKSLAATRGLLPLEDFLMLFHKHCFATYAIAACGTPRFPISCHPSCSEDILSDDFYEPYHRIGFIPPLPIHLQRLRMALALDQPSTLVNYRQLFSTDVQTFSPTHFYAEFLTLTLDLFAQQQNFFMQVVLSACNARHSRYFHEGAEECNGFVPVSNLKSGFTKSLEMIDATPAQVEALVEHLRGYDALLNDEEVLRVEQFTDLPFLFTSYLSPGDVMDGESGSVDMDNLHQAVSQPSGNSEEQKQLGEIPAGADKEGWHFEDETADCSLLHLSLAIRMLYPVWGMSALKQAKRLSELLLTWTPITKIDKNASSIPPIIQVNAPSTPFEMDIQNRYLISAQHLAQGNSGYLNPLRVTAKWILEESRLAAEANAKEELLGIRNSGRRKSLLPTSSAGYLNIPERILELGDEVPNYNFEIPVDQQMEGGGIVPTWRLLRQSFSQLRHNAFGSPSQDRKHSRDGYHGQDKGRRRRRSNDGSGGRRSSSASSAGLRQEKTLPAQRSGEKAKAKVIQIDMEVKNGPSAASLQTMASSAAQGSSFRLDKKKMHEGGRGAGGSSTGEMGMTVSSSSCADGGRGNHAASASAPPPTRDFGLYILSRAMGMSRSYCIQGLPSNKKKKGGKAKKVSPGLPFGVELQLQLQTLHFGNTLDMLRSSRPLLFNLLAPLKDGSSTFVHDHSSYIGQSPKKPTQLLLSQRNCTPPVDCDMNEKDGDGLHSHPGGHWSHSKTDSGRSSHGNALKKTGKGSPIETLQLSFSGVGRGRGPGSPNMSTHSLACPPWAPAFRHVSPTNRRRSTLTRATLSTQDPRLSRTSSNVEINSSPKDEGNKILLYVEDLRSAMAALSLIS